MLIIFMLGYIPDRAYYFTVSPTIDLGYNAISPINLCPAANQTLPCPAPGGAVIPWQESPSELALPEGRTGAGTFTSGINLYLIGGMTDGAATASVLATKVDNSNLAAWQDGPALPEPRTGATVLNLSGTPYVVGGADASGAPTDSVFKGTVEDGALTGWEALDINLPVPLQDASGVATVTGLYVFGGRTADGLSAATYHTSLSTTGTPALVPWVDVTELPLPEARAGATAVSAGISIYVMGGEGPNGATDSVFYLGLDTHGDPAVNPDTGRPFGWGVSANQSASATLPEPRVGHTSFANGGAIYVIGGKDADGHTVATNYWTEPSPTNGTISGWQRLDATDLPAPRSQAAVASVATSVFLIGGSDANGADLSSTLRADLAPQLPFFRLGLFGVTVPALSIQGQIGQQLGYIVAGSAGAGNLIILILIGWAFSHRPQTFRFFQWITRGRFRAPREDEYTA